jgi:PAS domain S-box-containing protein
MKSFYPSSIRGRLPFLLFLSVMLVLSLTLYTAWKGPDRMTVWNVIFPTLAIGLMLLTPWIGGTRSALIPAKTILRSIQPPAPGDLASRIGGQSGLRKIDGLPRALNQMVETTVTQAAERGAIKESFSEGKNRARCILGRGLIGRLLTSQDGRILDANPNVCRILGYSKEELIQHGRSVIVDESDPLWAVVLEEQKRTGIFEGELTLIRKDGIKFSAHISSVVFQTGDGEYRTSMLVRDITEDKRALEDLRKSEQRYKSFFEHMVDAAYSLDLQGKITSVNRAACKISGYSQEDLLKKRYEDITAADELKNTRAHFQEAALGNPQQYHSAIIHKNGHRVDLYVSNVPTIVAGKVVGVYGMARDITERKRMAENLGRESALNAIMAELSEKILKAESQREIAVLTLRKAKELTGSQLGNVSYLDSNTGHLVCPTIEDVWEQCQIPGKSLFPMELRGLGGWVFKSRNSLLINDLSSDPRTSGIPVGHIPIRRYLAVPALHGEVLVGHISLANAGRDYTEIDLLAVERLISIFALGISRKQAEESLRQSEVKFRTLFELESDSLFLIDNTSGQILEVNSAASRLYGYSREELLAKKNTDMSAEPLETRVATMERRLRVPLRFHRKKDGSIFPVEIAASHLTWKDQPAHIAAIRDITDREKAEEEREKLMHDLQKGHDQMRELSHRLMEIQEIERRLLARELHDKTGQSLAVLGLNLTVIRNELANKGLEGIISRVDTALEAVKEIAGQVRNVMEDLRPSVLDDYGLSSALNWFTQRLEAQTGIPIRHQGEDIVPRPPISTELALFRIAQEALINAVRYARANEIQVILEADDKFIRLSVIDDGIGFNMEGQFKEEKAGRWGLIDMKERAEAIQGKFLVESHAGKGTRIVVELAR